MTLDRNHTFDNKERKEMVPKLKQGGIVSEYYEESLFALIGNK